MLLPAKGNASRPVQCVADVGKNAREQEECPMEATTESEVEARRSYGERSAVRKGVGESSRRNNNNDIHRGQEADLCHDVVGLLCTLP